MSRDFTYRTYADLLDAAQVAGFEFLTVRQLLSDEPLPPRFLVLRHDVVRKPKNALDFARIEAKRDVRGTYYVRSVEGTLDPEIVADIERLGHEVGYCSEDLDRADGDRELAGRMFGTHLRRLRRHATVHTVCPHENPLTDHDNAVTWSDEELLDHHGLLGDAASASDAVDLPRFSDDGRTWADGETVETRASVAGAVAPVEAETTEDLIDLVRRHRVSRAWLRIHPNRWADSYPEFVASRTRDAAVQAARRGLSILP